MWRNSSSPSLSGVLATRGASFGVFLQGSVAYVGISIPGFLIADVSAPAIPNRFGQIAITGETQACKW